MRKVFIVCFCVLLLIGCAIPAFAYTTEEPDPGNGYYLLYPSLQFDYISSDVGVYEWPFNCGMGVGEVTGFSFSGGIFSGEMYFDGSSDPVMQASASIPADGSITLSSDLMPFYKTLPGYFDFFIDPVKVSVTSVDFSFYVWYFVRQSDGSYKFKQDWITHQTSYNAASFDIVSELSSLVSSYSGAWVFLADVQITFNFRRLTPDTFSFRISSPSAADLNTKAFNWFYTANFPPPPNLEELNFGSWLVDTVEAVLDFEVAPNLSINKILYIVLVIGVLLWFITLLI